MKPTLTLTDDEKAEDTIAYLMAENERLRGLLFPFADAYFYMLDNPEGGFLPLLDKLEWKHFRAAIDEFGGYSGMQAARALETE